MLWLVTYLKSRYPNRHTVVPGRLYRSATPKPEDLGRWVGEHDIQTWVDLRMPKDWEDDPLFFEDQCATAKRLKVERISLPCDDFGEISDAQIQVFLDIACDNTKAPVLVACRGGRHRAGLMVAMFRVRIQRWAEEKAFADAKACGYYAHGHKVFDKRFRQLLGMTLCVLLSLTSAFGQHPFITPAVQINTHPFIHLDRTDKESLTVEPVSNPHKFDRSFWLATTAWLGGSTADLVTTKFALDRGGIERNPLHAREGGHKLRWTSAIAATAGTVAFAAYLERRGHRRFARVMLYAGAVVRGSLAVWNHKQRR